MGLVRFPSRRKVFVVGGDATRDIIRGSRQGLNGRRVMIPPFAVKSFDFYIKSASLGGVNLAENIENTSVPLRDNVFVKMSESLPNSVGLMIPTTTKNWTDASLQLGNIGTVISLGKGKRHSKSGILLYPHCKVGDVIRFSQLKYPTWKFAGETYVIINDQDIVGIEEKLL